MLKILQISNKAPYPANDGSSIAIYNMAEGFIANGVNLHLLTINTKKHYKPDENVPEDFKDKSHYLSVYHDTNTSAIGAFLNLFTTQSYFVSRFYFKEFENVLINKLKNETFDFIQLEGLFVGVYLDVIRKYSKAKIVLRAHNVEYLIWERHILVEKSFIKKKYLQLQTKRLKEFELDIIKKVDAIVSITDIDKNYLQLMVPRKAIFTCITGVNAKQYQSEGSGNKKPKTIFSFSSMDWMPNQEAVEWFLNNCWEKVHKAVPECKFVIAGRNMPPKFRQLNLPNVLIIENVANSKDFYSQHEIMLVPLLSGSGLRIKIIEGMAYGKAIVSTSIGAEGINVVNEKHILIADKADDFSNAVISLLQDENTRKSIEANARFFAQEEFDNKKVVEKLVNFYNSLNV